MRQKRTIRGRRSMLKLLGLAAVGATAGVVTGRVIDIADSGAGSGSGADGAASRAAGGPPSSNAPAPAPPGPRGAATLWGGRWPLAQRQDNGARRRLGRTL